MRWFKHDSDAHMDAKMRRLIHKWGIEGYGLYWYCLELIAKDVGTTNLTFELEHDAEILAHDMRMSREKVEDMMRYMIDLKLFEGSEGRITCLKLFNRIDLSQGGTKAFRDAVLAKRKEVKNGQSHDAVMTKSCIDIEVDIDLEDRNKKHLTSSPPASDPIPYKEIVSAYHTHLPDLPSCRVVTAKRKAAIRQRHLGIMERDLDNWVGFFKMAGRSKFLMGQIPGKDWRASFDFLITEKAAVGVLEGKYK